LEELKQTALFVTIFAAIYDVLTGRIPNWLTFSTIILALLARVFLEGMSGLGQGALATVSGFGLYLPLFYFGVMGGGDVKLLMAVGALTSVMFVSQTAIVAIMVGGVYALVDTLARGRLLHIFRVTQGLLLGWLRPRDAKDMVDGKRKFPFGFAIAAAVALLLVWERQS
jgi:prepilin peptidase CpaA